MQNSRKNNKEPHYKYIAIKVMKMAKDIFRNKKDFARQEFTTEVSPPMRSYVSPRESKSQKAQYKSGGKPGFRKDVKTPMKHKET